jgi:transposase
MSKQYDKEFKENAVRYYKDHDELTLKKCSENLGIAASTLDDWIKKADSNNGKVPTRGSGNYSSDEAKENARLKKELRDTKDALDILKKAIGILGK